MVVTQEDASVVEGLWNATKTYLETEGITPTFLANHVRGFECVLQGSGFISHRCFSSRFAAVYSPTNPSTYHLLLLI